MFPTAEVIPCIASLYSEVRAKLALECCRFSPFFAESLPFLALLTPGTEMVQAQVKMFSRKTALTRDSLAGSIREELVCVYG